MIKAIETRYKGYRFRSRLEARWAVFFETLKLRWQYEPEGFELPSGTRYLPDFRIELPGGKILWIEIKPEGQDSKQFEEFIASCSGYSNEGTILHDIPDPTFVRDHLGIGYYKGGSSPWVLQKFKYDNDDIFSGDGPYLFCVCERCGSIGFEFDGRSARIQCCGANINSGDSKNYSSNHQRILNALAAARAARFEHDEREVWA
jgi:hypothetical protein